jgi:hypothetical protein
MINAETCCRLVGILLLEPFEYHSVCFFRLFLLNPMAAIQIDHLYIGYEISQVLGLRHWITVPINHERGLLDDRTHVPQQMPVAIGVVAWITDISERALPETDFMRYARSRGGQVRSSG